MNQRDDFDTGPLELFDAGAAERQQAPSKPPKPPNRTRTQIAAIHTHFNMFRDIHDAHEGEVTVDEQIKGLERFVRWHTRQTEVGKKLLTQLIRAKEMQEGSTSAKRAS